ncbi:threonylcarbamoyl-AMP synthase [Neolewinella aurantiaca]|uniref:Threonylcarbamoyl-AMP synthase n=1 Tax=Neolewinella aurantiaca TaxID=2602767 RepID=A0A5C7FBX7_9BACT|nr:L-threonylcarbamoyladenylate synthase [Neolewinella aurantiaca]TXF87633.1 threonylcarbamoyl-AMP synthase [Neolewinella aurantiaca]
MKAVIGNDVQEAAGFLSEGKLVAIPTETVYGLGANALNETAVAGIFAAKNRPSFDPLIIHQSSPERILRYARDVPADAQKLADAFWPGPLTLVLPKKEIIPDLVSAGLDTVALRVPDHPLARKVLDLVDFPVAAPSANPFGFVSPTTAQHVADQLGEKIDFILDGGPCRVGLESTIVGFSGGKTTVLRKGGLPIEDIEALLGHPVTVRTHGSSQPEAPGMLSRHYSPGNRIELFDEFDENLQLPANSAWITFGGTATAFCARQPLSPAVFDLSPEGNLAQAAQQLFSVLRLMAERKYEYVAVQLLPEAGLGRAINDRLRRAAATE